MFQKPKSQKFSCELCLGLHGYPARWVSAVLGPFPTVVLMRVVIPSVLADLGRSEQCFMASRRVFYSWSWRLCALFLNFLMLLRYGGTNGLTKSYKIADQKLKKKKVRKKRRRTPRMDKFGLQVKQRSGVRPCVHGRSPSRELRIEGVVVFIHK